MGKLRVLFVAFLMLLGCCCLSGCGKHAMTEKEMDYADDLYERNRITDEEYREYCEAYLNGDPAPKRGFFKRVGDFLESTVLFVIGVGVIGSIIYVCRKK